MKLHNTSLSRRNAIKLIAISPVTATLLLSEQKSDASEPQKVKGKIVIVGGGAGAIMILSRLLIAIEKPDITIVAPNDIHLYQPGQVFVGAGEMVYDDLIIDNNNYIDQKRVTWIKDEVKTFLPKKNILKTRAGEIIKYNYLIVATGIEYHYEKIKGLTKDDIGKNGITSVYLNDLQKGTAKGATATWDWFRELKEFAKTKKPKVIYTQPNTPIKCGGAPQKILYLSADYLKKDGLSAEYSFVTSSEKLFSLPEIDSSLHKVQDSYDKIENKFGHHLQSIDIKAKKATFIHAYDVEEVDKDFGTKEIVSKTDTVVLDYDFIHIVPPMSPVKALMDSDLVGESGWLDVDKHTLQHKKYKNVFGLGDTCGIPMGKTGGSVRHQGPIVTQNLIDVMNSKKPSRSFDGYTVCPIKTEYGKIIMAEFNYKGAAPTLPLAYDKPRWIWWAFDLYMLEPIYKYLMLTGRF